MAGDFRTAVLEHSKIISSNFTGRCYASSVYHIYELA